MHKAILSPCLLKPKEGSSSQEEMVHYLELSKVMSILEDFCDVRFEYYKKAPYESYKMDIPEYKNNLTLNNLVTTNIYVKLLKMMEKTYVDLDEIEPAECITDMEIPNVPGKEAFLRYLNYVKGDAIMFIGKDNYRLDRPFRFKSDVEFDVDTSHAATIETTDVLLKYLRRDINYDVMFPMEGLCKDYNAYVIKEIESKRMDQNEKNALFEKIGNVVAIYNFYTKNQRLCTLNSSRSKKRIVYTKNVGIEYHLSLDFESGGFEVFDKNYVHMGQYNFSCIIAKKAQPKSHVLMH